MDEGYDGINVDRARDLAAGRPLAALPPEAFETRSAKGRSAPADLDDDEPRGERVTDPDLGYDRGRHRARPAPAGARIAVLIAIVALAALLRLPAWTSAVRGTPIRARTCSSCRALVDRRRGAAARPARRRSGTFHHGAVYYYLLAPAAYLTDADPVAVTTEIALFGIGAVDRGVVARPARRGTRRRARRRLCSRRSPRQASRPRRSSGTRT